MRTGRGTNTVWIRLFLAWSLFLASAGATRAMGASILQPETQESLGARLRTAAIVVFRSLRPLARRLGVELDLAAVDEFAVMPITFETGKGGEGASLSQICGRC